MSDHPSAGLDIETLRTRYFSERDKRTAKGKGERQYRDIASGFAHLLEDPYRSVSPRAAIKDSVDVLIVGGGFGGLLSAARLKEAGVKKVRIIDVASDVGGTWYWNRYPGAACDIESYIYFPLLEETGYMPTERYAKAEEIKKHSQRIAKHFDLYKDAVFSTQVTSMDWQADEAEWLVKTSRDDVIRARFVVLTTGPLNRPKLPDIPGIETFKGRTFHTSRWDYDYTGGTATTPLSGLVDKRVGIIGTGATAIQCVPPLANCAQELFVFQRTPSSVDARNNTKTDPEWVKSLTPGWQQRRMENFTAQFTEDLPEGDDVADGWTALAAAVRRKIAEKAEMTNPGALLEEADFEKMEEIRRRIGEIVKDQDTADALKPWFSLYCKRPCFHDEYLQVFNQPNVHLVDTEGRGVEEITEAGVVVGGKSHELDCLIFATGFEVASSLEQRSGIAINGVAGHSLSQKWSRGVETLHGMHVRGFPNCFVVSQTQAGMSPNFPHMLSEQASHIAHIVGEADRRAIKTIEPTQQAEADWVGTIVKMGEARRAFIEACTPGYYNNEGRPSTAAAKSGVYAAGPIAFIRVLKAWRDAGDFAGMDINGAHARETKGTGA